MKIKLTLVDLHGCLVDAARKIGWEINCLPWTDIRTIKPEPGMFFVSPANSLGFMDGGIDYVLSRIMFPDIQRKVKAHILSKSYKTLLGRPYLPIGQAVIVETQFPGVNLIAAPTMWLPQDVRQTHNAYHAMYAILEKAYDYQYEQLETKRDKEKEKEKERGRGKRQEYNMDMDQEAEIILCGLCTGCGMMSPDEAIKQMFEAYTDYEQGLEPKYDHDAIVAEQPMLYMNSEFKPIDPDKISHV